MHKIKHVKLGDYVMVSVYSDHDQEDPHYVGYIKEYGVNKTGLYYRVEGSNRYWRHVFRITEEEGLEILERGRELDQAYQDAKERRERAYHGL